MVAVPSSKEVVRLWLHLGEKKQSEETASALLLAVGTPDFFRVYTDERQRLREYIESGQFTTEEARLDAYDRFSEIAYDPR